MHSVLPVLVPAIGWALLHFIWQGLLIGWGASLLLFLLRGARPQTRYAVACGAMLLCAVVPLAGIVSYVANADAGADGSLLSAALPALLPQAHSLTSAAGAGQTAAVSLPALPGGGVISSIESVLRHQLPLVVGLWLAGAALMSLRLAIGLQWVSERTRADHYTVNHYWQRRLSELARRFGLDIHVRLGVADLLDSPITAGCWRPIVLVPAALVSGMPPELLEALLAHELAHIKRRDYLVNLIQSAIEVALFYHPCVWSLSRRIRVEREQIADDLAVEMLGQPQRLAQALSELDRFQFATTQLAHAAHGGNLMSRIKRLLRPDVEPVSWKMALPLIGLCAAGAVFYVQAAPQPESAAVLHQEMHYHPDSSASESPPAPPAPPAVPAVRASAAPPAPAMPALRAVPPAPPVPAVPAIPAIPEVPPSLKGERHVHVHDKSSRTAYALVQGDHEDGVTMSGNSSDYRRVEQLRGSVNGDFLWYRDGDQAWLVRDPAILAKAHEAWAPVSRIGEQMNEQGKKMDEQGKVMDALGRKMGEAGRMAAESHERDMRGQEREIEKLAMRQESYARAADRIAQRLERDGATETERASATRDIERLHAQMAPLQQRMAELQRVLSERSQKMVEQQAPMKEISRQMSEASKPMAELGRQMGELGRQQAEASRAAEETIKSLIQEARKTGKAAPAPAPSTSGAKEG